MDRNISKEKRDKLLEKIHSLQQNADDESFKILNEIENELTKNIYGLVWEEHSEDVDDELISKIPIFEEVKKKTKIIDKEKELNFILEGDNLHSLLLLEKTHKNKIDLIYIDPPYNTGASKWKYNNDYISGTDVFKHSKWLSMMNRRLVIAKRLLKDDGVLICAIDENEIATLKLLLETIFGTDYQVDVITIVHNPRGVQGDNFSYTNEYALFVYRKHYKVIGEKEVEEEDIDWNPLRNWGSESLRTDAKNCFYGIRIKDNKIVGFDDVLDDDVHPKKNEALENGEIVIYPIDQSNIERKWRYARQSVESIVNILRVIKRDDEYDIEIGKPYAPYKTVWTEKKYDANEYGTQLISSMVPANDFDFPKSLWNVYECLFATIKNNPDATVLDFFAGSGTTGHAVELMNNLLGGNRKYILATNNVVGEKKDKEFIRNIGEIDEHKKEYEEYCDKYGICSSITYPRMLATSEGYIHNKNQKIVLFEKKLNRTLLNKIDDVKEEMKKIEEDNKEKYDSFEITFENDSLILLGIVKKGEKVKGIPHNIVYYKTNFVNKRKDGTMSSELLKHIKELIQIEFSCLIDNKKTILIFNEDELDEKLNKDLSICKRLFKPSYVLLTSKQKKITKELNIKVIDIPEYYFRYELMEADEI